MDIMHGRKSIIEYGLLLMENPIASQSDIIHTMKDLLFSEVHEMKGFKLDLFLNAGWYRVGHKMFTTNFIEDFGHVYPVYWLRYDVTRLSPEKSYQKLQKINKGFTVESKSFELTDELEELHSLYFMSIDFITTSSIRELMMDTSNVIFDSKIIEIRHNNTLIAAGIFDQGIDSIAGIKNIYHPDYKKYSLGKYLIWLKYQYCLHQGIQWYYPGYFAPQNPKFNYKVEFDKNGTEVLLTLGDRAWVPLSDFR